MNKIKYILLCVVGAMFLVACNEVEEDAITDPTAIYSIIKEDTSGIDVVSLSGSNPLWVRKQIALYEIPERTFEDKKTTLYKILDTLSTFTFPEGEDVYAIIDSLNYMAVHYMLNILRDKKSVNAPLKHKMLKTVASADRMLRIYTLNENIGIEYDTYINVYQYADENRTMHVCAHVQDYGTANCELLCGKPINAYKLNYKGEKGSLYLVNIEGGISGEENFKGSIVLSQQNDSLIFNYKGFEPNANTCIYTYLHTESVTCNYNYKRQQLDYKIKNAENETQTITYLFNGEQFELKQE